MSNNAFGGFPEALFVQKPSEHFYCGICLDILKKPQQCVNGHNFCLTCITETLRNRTTCPSCNVEIDARTLSNSLTIRDLISGLQVKCRSSNCIWTGELKELENHVANCSLAMIPCPLYVSGYCGGTCMGMLLRKDFESHKQSMLSLHAADMFDKVITECHVKDAEIVDMYKSLEVGYHGPQDELGNKSGHGLQKSRNGTTYFGQFQNNKYHGTGVYITPLFKFSGIFQHGEAFDGTLQAQNGNWEKGKFVNGKLNGTGSSRLQCGEDGFCTYIGEFIDGIRKGFGIDTLSNGDIYEGQWDGGTLIGVGKVKYKDGNIYEGTFNDLRCLHGQGKMTFADGGVYEGQFENDDLKGKGTYRSSAFVYEGEWENFCRHGYGKLVGCDGDVYEGQWESNFRHGNGKYICGRDVYEGQWKNNNRHGTGALTCDGCVVYEGQWENDQGNGTGKFTWDGEVYEGQWKNHKRHGTGICTYDGGVYEGQWENDMGHGAGKLTHKCGDVYEGQWENDEPHGEGKMLYANGSVYEGQWKEGMHHGKGKLSSNDSVYDGQWENNKRHGAGKHACSTGTYDGNWECDMRHGVGKFTGVSNDVYEGSWEFDKRHGVGVLRRGNSGDVFAGEWKNSFLHIQSFGNEDADDVEHITIVRKRKFLL